MGQDARTIVKQRKSWLAEIQPTLQQINWKEINNASARYLVYSTLSGSLNITWCLEEVSVFQSHLRSLQCEVGHTKLWSLEYHFY